MQDVYIKQKVYVLNYTFYVSPYTVRQQHTFDYLFFLSYMVLLSTESHYIVKTYRNTPNIFYKDE